MFDNHYHQNSLIGQFELLRIIGENSGTRAAKLSKEYIKAGPGEKEAIQAGIEFEKWMYEIAQLCLNRSKAS